MEPGDNEYEEGRMARRKGKPKSANPYPPEDTYRHNGWLRGWQSLAVM